MSDEAESSPTPPTAHSDAALEPLLDYLRRSRGFDFGGYKQSSLGRRIHRRMQAVGATTYAEYTDYLEVHPDEFPQLFNMILINVTAFYRDPAAWAALSGYVAGMLERRDSGKPIRVWSAGCASGEEAFTLAMMFAEHLGVEEAARRVKIYATDVDEEALAQARQSMYGAKAIEALPSGHVDKYFVRTGNAFVFHKDLRRAVIFGRHDLVQDAPISRVDLLTCRNALMYFNAETQLKILSRLNFALADEGLLFLGKAEMLLTHANLFSPVDLKLRIFRRAARTGARRERLVGQNIGNGAGNAAANENGSENERAKLQRAGFDSTPLALLVVDTNGRVSLVNQRAADTFGLTARDLGRLFQDLELSHRPVELRSSIEQAMSQRRVVYLREVERSTPNGEKVYFDVCITPLVSEVGAALGVQVSFADITHFQRLGQELRKAKIEIEAAHEEVQSASEELETTNEELQSTVEELETTNEELQSTNEELETMNEELQSTNEELQSLIEELRQSGADLKQANAFFAAILRSFTVGVAVLDKNHTVNAWNHEMEELWGLRADEVEGKHLQNLDIGLPVDAVRNVIRACLTNDAAHEETLDATNRRGKKIRCEVTATPLRSETIEGVILLVEDLGG